MQRIDIRQMLGGIKRDGEEDIQAWEKQRIALSPTSTTGDAFPSTTVLGASGPGVGGGGGSAGTGGDGAGNPQQGQGGSTTTPTPSDSSGTSVQLPQPTVVKFDDTDNFPTSSYGHVFATQNDKKVFKWAVNSTTTVKDVTWYTRNNNTDDFLADGHVIVSATSPFSSQAQDPFTDVTTQNATLNLRSNKLSQLQWQEMVIKIDWETPDATGYSESGVFTVATVTNNLDVQDFNDNVGTAQDTRGGEDITYKNTIQPAGPVSISKTGGGLSTGAIAGIAVAGVVVFLLIVGGLAWFFLRRRRNQAKGGFNGQQTTGSFIAGKEEAQSRVAESPVSPYSDDGHGGVRDAVQHAPRSTNETLPPVASTSGTRLDDAPAPQAAVSRNIAHLVEEGMTEDEIRRLEEEERHLDAEIERTARGEH